MAALVLPELKYEYTFHWKIENLFRSILKQGQSLDSPTFTAGNTKWSLKLYPSGYENEDYVGFFINRDVDCRGPDEIKVCFKIVFRLKDNTILEEIHLSAYGYGKNRAWGISNCFAHKIYCWKDEKKSYFEDTVMVECTMYKKEETNLKPKNLYARTTFMEQTRCFTWKLDKFSTLQPGVSKKFEDDTIDFDVILYAKGIFININAIDESIKRFSVMSSVKKHNVECQISDVDDFFSDDLKIGKLTPRLFYFQSCLTQSQTLEDVSFDFQYFIPIKTAFYESCEIYKKPSKLTENVVDNRKAKTVRPSMLVKDLEFLYKDAICSDIELRIPSKAFKAHKNILSARSLVFRRMFSNDMKEKRTGQVNIIDFEEDTVHRMLMYMYTDSLEDLQFESASNLYRIADKYEIISLKSRCSSFLTEIMCPENACDILVLADLYKDDDLKSTVQDYILQQDKTFFTSEKWTNFMDNNLKLAADVMYKNIKK